MRNFLTAALMVLGISMTAHAGFVVEPAVGVQGITGQTQFEYKFANNTTQKYTQQSYPVSLTFKYQTANGFWYGVRADDYLGGTFSKVTNYTTANDTFTRLVASAQIGYESAKGIRAWVGYDAVNQITNTPGTTSNNNNYEFTSLSGTGYQVGLGWKFHSHVAVNAMYDVPTYTGGTVTAKTGSSATNTIGTNGYNTFTDGYWNINVSFPFGGSK